MSGEEFVLEVNIEVTNHEMQVTISDTGNGMSVEVLKKFGIYLLY
jgi:signal transduction histidine kinase